MGCSDTAPRSCAARNSIIGLSKAALRFIAIEHRRKPFSGSAVTLGRQCVYATFGDVQQILRDEGIHPSPLPAGVTTSTNLPDWKGTALEARTSDVAFFHALGMETVEALDVDGFEGAEILWDLNQPVSPELLSRFDLIVDAGTLEHIFDVRTAMMNLVRMLRPGRRILHFSPANNFCNHGFFQLSPTLFADYYAANQFPYVSVYLAEESLRNEQTRCLDLFEFQTQRQPCLIASPLNKRLQSVCIAESGPASTADRIPTQSYYSAVFTGSPQSTESRRLAEREHIPSSRLARLAKRWLPYGIYLTLRAVWMSGRASMRKPWGLKFWRRLK